MTKGWGPNHLDPKGRTDNRFQPKVSGRTSSCYERSVAAVYFAQESKDAATYHQPHPWLKSQIEERGWKSKIRQEVGSSLQQGLGNEKRTKNFAH